MPRGDMTGPLGQGKMTGRGLGRCAVQADSANQTGAVYGRGMGCGLGRGFNRGFGRGMGSGLGRGACYYGYDRSSTVADDKQFLSSQKSALEARLEMINRQLKED